VQTATESRPTFITPSKLLEHWQGHQRLTRRVIEAFPDDRLFTFQPAPPMRPFGALVLEIIHMVAPTLEGLASGNWAQPDWDAVQKEKPGKAEVLALWDETAGVLGRRWPELPEARFHEVVTAFGQWTMPGSELILYLIDNEVHHRAQGYVYMRLLNIEPPAFYER